MLGERYYIIRVMGGWIFLALFYVATERVARVLNPVVAIMALSGGGPGTPSVLDSPAALDGGFAYAGALAAMACLLAIAFSTSLVRISRTGGSMPDA